jgi:hypothetical protein
LIGPRGLHHSLDNSEAEMTFDEPETYSWCITIWLNELTQLLKAFIDNEPNTRIIELHAERLMKDEDLSESDLRDFVKAVCKWAVTQA